MKALVLALARCSTDDVNATVSARDLRTSLHLACAMGNLAMTQLLIWVNIFPFVIKIIEQQIIFFIAYRTMPTLNKQTTRDVHVYHTPKPHVR